MGFIDLIKARARADKKTIVLPESMDRRTWEAAETILKEDIANLIIIGTPEDIADHSKGLDVSGATATFTIRPGSIPCSRAKYVFISAPCMLMGLFALDRHPIRSG